MSADNAGSALVRTSVSSTDGAGSIPDLAIDDLALDHATVSAQLERVRPAPTWTPSRPMPFAESRAPSAPTLSRVGYCGASDIAAILGMSPFHTPLDVWAAATGRVERKPSTPELEAGNDHEAAVIAGYARRVARAQLVERVEHPGPGTLLSPRDRRRGATPDAIAHHVRWGPIVAEAKYVGAGASRAWGDESLGADGVPEHVLCQVHWQTLTVREVYGWSAPIAHVAADLGTDRRVYEVEIDDAMIDAMLEAFVVWWRAHVEHDEPPSPCERDLATLALLYPAPRRPLSMYVPHEVEMLAAEYAVAREAVKLAEKNRDGIAALLCSALGESEGYRWRGGKAVWSPRVRASVDWQTIARELGASQETIDKHTETATSRVLDVRLKRERW